MKSKIKKIISLEKASFLLLALPYIGFNWVNLYQSPFFTYTNLFVLVVALITIEVIFKIGVNNGKHEKLFTGIILTNIFIYFYGFYLILIIQKHIQQLTDLLVRGRVIIIFIILILVTVQLIFKRINYYKSLNIFLLIFSSVNFIGNYQSLGNKKQNINQIKNSYQQIKLTEKSNKPVILLISDEYNSPDGLYKVYKDSSIYNFSTYLQNHNWIIRNTAYTLEISTIHSLSSLFNFNLSKASNYSKFNISDIGGEKLIKAALYDSLALKKINLINFGIFDIGKSEPLSNLYQYPKNFVDQFLNNTVNYHVKNNTNDLKIEGFNQSFYLYEEHNKFIIDNLSDSLKIIRSNNFFAYAHLYMPHAPKRFRNEFKVLIKDDLNSYTSYWMFTNQKLKKMLSELIKENKYRIILTGDHGYRSDARVNASHTFMAFYGFDEHDLSSIKSVQDLGNLINACY
jgi:hypothetical protein